MTCCSAAVEPTSDSALPIRAKLSGDPDIVGRKGGMTCSSAAVEPTSDSALPIRAKLDGAPIRTDGCVKRTLYKREREDGDSRS